MWIEQQKEQNQIHISKNDFCTICDLGISIITPIILMNFKKNENQLVIVSAIPKVY